MVRVRRALDHRCGARRWNDNVAGLVEGHIEYAALLDSLPENLRDSELAEALQEIRLQPDPVDLALAMSGDLSEETLRGYIEDRIRVLAAQHSQLEHQRERVWPDQTVADDLVVEHARLRVQAELSWHQTVLDQLGKLMSDSDRTAARA